MIIILSGSSASGKNTLINELLKTEKDIQYIQTFSSREMREGESEGHPYHFITKEEFQNKIKNGDFFEHELIHNNFYGVDKNICLDYINKNIDIIKDMGVYGTFNLKEKLENITKVQTIFLYVDKKTLKKRLINRGEKQIKLRLKRYKTECKNIYKYNFLIDNYDKELSLRILSKLIKMKGNDYEEIIPLKSKIKEKKVKKYMNKFINNKHFKPIKIYFDGENLFIKRNIEKYIASILTNKTLTKKIVFDKKIREIKNPNLITDYIDIHKNA